MPMSSQQVLDLVTQRTQSGFLGVVEAHRRFNSHTVAERELIDALVESHGQTAAVADPYPHPATAARSVAPAAVPRNADGSPGTPQPYHLTPSDVAWLTRLPHPDQITDADARELAKLAALIERSSGSTSTNSSDARLITSIWEPVRARHDAAQARHDLAQVQVKDPWYSHGAVVSALAEAIAAEVPGLTGKEQVARAQAMFKTYLDEHATTDRVSTARKAVDALSQARRDRERITT